jgi:hypothetical protein
MHKSRRPMTKGCLEQSLRTNHIRMDEDPRTVNGSINMRLRCEMHYGIRFGDQPVDQVGVTDVSMDKSQPRIIANRVKVRPVTGVCEGVQDSYRRYVS